MSNNNLKPVIQETVNLPSKGIIYDGLAESFSIRPMTVNELKMLYGASNTMAALSQILESVVDAKKFNIDELVSADKLYLAFMLRAITFGEEYKANPYCPQCKKSMEVSFSLIKDVEIEYLKDDFKNPRSIGKLPVSGDEIEIKLLTNKDFEKILNRAKRIRKDFPDYQGDPIYPVTLAAQIVSINNKQLPSRDLEEYILDMHAKDDAYINVMVKKDAFGPKMPVSVECPECASELFVNVPIAEDFFRPELEF